MTRPEGGGKQRLRQPSAVIPGLRFPLFAWLQLALAIAGIGACAGCYAAGFEIPPYAVVSKEYGLVLEKKAFLAATENSRRVEVPRKQTWLTALHFQGNVDPTYAIYIPGRTRENFKYGVWVPKSFFPKGHFNGLLLQPGAFDERAYINEDDYAKLRGGTFFRYGQGGTIFPDGTGGYSQAVAYVFLGEYPGNQYGVEEIGDLFDKGIEAQNTAEFCAFLEMTCHLIPGVNSALTGVDHGFQSYEFGQALTQDAVFFAPAGPVKIMVTTGALGFGIRDLKNAKTSAQKMTALIQLAFISLDVHQTIITVRPRAKFRIPTEMPENGVFKIVAEDIKKALTRPLNPDGSRLAGAVMYSGLMADIKGKGINIAKAFNPMALVDKIINNMSDEIKNAMYNGLEIELFASLRDKVPVKWNYKYAGKRTGGCFDGNNIWINPDLAAPGYEIIYLGVNVHEFTHVITETNPIFNGISTLTIHDSAGNIVNSRAGLMKRNYMRIARSEVPSIEAEMNFYKRMMDAGGHIPPDYEKRIMELLAIMDGKTIQGEVIAADQRGNEIVRYLENNVPKYIESWKEPINNVWDYILESNLKHPGETIEQTLLRENIDGMSYFDAMQLDSMNFFKKK